MYDIRGLVDEEITDELAEKIGRAYAKLRRSELPEGRQLTMVVGRDMRESSIRYQKHLIQGLVASGVRVLDIGLVSTPAFYFGVGHAGADGGIMVSASHNPAAYNGFKITREEAIPVSGDTGIMDIRDMVEVGDFKDADEHGSIEEVSNIPALAVEAELNYVGKSEIKPLKIVVDTANGMGAQYMDELFKRIPGELIRMYWEFDGSFPNHEADPLKPENIADLQKRVIDERADLGIAIDGDGDRIFYVDEKGHLVSPAIVRGLLSQITLRAYPDAIVCRDIRPGKITDDMIIEAGGTPSITRVGHSLIKEQMRDVGAVFGGESSGHFFYRFPVGVFEGPVVATVHILQEMTSLRKKLSEIVEPLERYVHSGEINFIVEDKQAAVQKIKDTFADGELSELDGITITYPDFWFNVRGSNTEPKLRLNLEAIDQATMEAKRDQIIALIESK